MRVVVIGGGFGGMATAARLAKSKHQVTLLEASDRLGGALSEVRRDGFGWDGGAHHTLLPAVIRDLFRKSGRPLERELDLEPMELVVEHRFADGSVLRLPGGSRGAQLRAVEELGAGLGTAWAEHIDAYGRDWELLRRDYFERPWSAELAGPELRRILQSRETLRRRVQRTLPDDRLRLAALHRVRLAGHSPRRVPAWLGLTGYMEQKFGDWRVPGGMHLLGTALAERLATRKVEVALATPALDLLVAGGRVRGVRTAGGNLEAEAVVVAIDPHRLPALAPAVDRTTSTTLPWITHLGLRAAGLPELGDGSGAEVVLHGEPTLTVRTGGTAPEGHLAWSVLCRAEGDRYEGHPDVLDLLAERGLDLRGHVVTRIDRSPAELSAAWGGSPFGIRWDGRHTVARRLGPGTPIEGVYAAGAHAAPGADLPFAGLSAALVAQVVG